MSSVYSNVRQISLLKRLHLSLLKMGRLEATEQTSPLICISSNALLARKFIRLIQADLHASTQSFLTYLRQLSSNKLAKLLQMETNTSGRTAKTNSLNFKRALPRIWLALQVSSNIPGLSQTIWLPIRDITTGASKQSQLLAWDIQTRRSNSSVKVMLHFFAQSV